ncbi:MAG: CPBP family intramembrane metalloprotease [Thermoleophilaceae bacterium]|nr:CPBP family intramembrane metalloprotease [Thermoleophilaceae bacterium]
MAHELAEDAPPPEPDRAGGPPEAPRWPSWFAPVGFVVAAFLTVLSAVLVGAVATLLGVDARDPGPVVRLVQTLLQDIALVLTAVALAASVARPRLWHFGLGRTRVGPLVAWAVAGYMLFLLVGQLYQAIFDPDGEQRIVERLGADDSMLALIAIGVLVVVLAPVVEEFFFRGFFYKALRTRFGFFVAALIDGLVFGVIHYTGAETLSILPIFVALGFVFCLVYERTGSLYPSIAIHAFNNAIAYAQLTRLSDTVPALLGAATVFGCLVAARSVRVGAPAVS